MPPIRPNNFVKSDSNTVPIVTPSDPVRTLGVIFLCLSLTVAGIAYGILTYLENNNQAVENRIKSIESSLVNVPLKDMLLFYNKIKAINSVLASHYYVTTSLNTLADLVESNTYFTSYNYTLKNSQIDINIGAVTNDMSGVVKQMDNILSNKYDKFIKSAELKNVSKGELDNVEFDINMTANVGVYPDYILTEDLKLNKKVIPIKSEDSEVPDLDVTGGTSNPMIIMPVNPNEDYPAGAINQNQR